MGLSKFKLGDLIQLEDERNSNGLFSLDDVKGISIQKVFIDTKADMEGVSLLPYIVVKPDFFVYVTVTSRNGEKITLAHNDSKKTFIVSSSYVVFSVKQKELLNSDYLFMYFNRPEFDRYSRFNSWGSARETFSWDDMCDIDIELPDIPTQQKYVNIYKAIVANQLSYERGLEDLKLVCDGYIEELRRNIPCEKIGPYIYRTGKNSDDTISKVLGVGQAGFILPQKTPNESLRNYKIIEPNSICYAPPLYNIKSDAIHFYEGQETAVCSPIYEVFKCDESKLKAAYLIMWLKRSEFKRYAEFYALGVRSTFDYSLMESVEIPVPPISIQESIIGIYNIYRKNAEINERMKAQIKRICPILIKGSIENAME